MASEYLLPAVGNRTTSPLASRKSIDSIDAVTKSSTYTLPQLPSLKNYPSRLSIGSSNSSSNASIRRPLSNIPTNNHDINKQQSQMDIDSDDSTPIYTSNFSNTSKSQRNETRESMQIDSAAPIIIEKSMQMCYPSQSKVPSRSLVQALYDEAIATDSNGDEVFDQIELCDAGLLSFEQVLLPAVAYQEEQMLKEWQSIVQRDGSPEQKSIVVALRKALYCGIGAACAAVKESRKNRSVQDLEREIKWQKEIEQKRVIEEEERQKQQDIIDDECREALRQRHRDLQKRLPANQEVWREVAYLMTELTKLSNEERQWHNVSNQYLDRTELDLAEQEKQLEEMMQNIESCKDGANSDAASDTVQEMVGRNTDTAYDITLAVDRIRNALRHVSNTVTHCEQSRRQLYHQYVTNHQFHGYQGVHDPKGLLKVLSQSQSDD